MNTRKNIIGLCALAALLLVTTACPTSQDAAFQTNRTVTAIAEANLGMERTVRKLNELKLITPVLTNDVLNYNRDVANGVKSAVVVLKSGKDWKVVGPEVLRLLRAIQLPPNVSAFVKAPAVDVGVQALVAVIGTVQLLIEQSIAEVQK